MTTSSLWKLQEKKTGKIEIAVRNCQESALGYYFNYKRDADLLCNSKVKFLFNVQYMSEIRLSCQFSINIEADTRKAV